VYSNADSARSPISKGGSSLRNLRSCVRTEADPSRIKGRSLGSRMAVGRGRGSLTGREESCDVRYERASRRWVSEREDEARER
jgi:hypothetical protein